MRLSACFALVLCAVVLQFQGVTGQNRFVKYAPFVESIIKHQADARIESEYQSRKEHRRKLSCNLTEV